MSVNWDMSAVDFMRPGAEPDPSLISTCRHTDYTVRVAIPVETTTDGLLQQSGSSWTYCPNCGHRYGQ